MSASRFLFAVCQRGAEAALKREVAREHGDLRFAFSRPGLVTFKREGALVEADFELRSVFARAHGASIGPAPDEAAVAALVTERFGERALRLHVFERDRFRPGEEPPDVTPGAHAAVVRARLAAALRTLAGELARPGELVIDVIVAEGEPLFVGYHVHGPGHSPHPGGRIPVVVPPEAPSRAYAKLEEALAWSGAPLRAGQTAVEIGSAPGGASYALVRRGLTVIGVDPGAMDPGVLATVGPGGARVTHLPVTLAALRREQLPARVDWLLMDVNLAPQVALHQVRRIVATLRPTLRGVLFTLKLNEWRFADQVPALLDRVRQMGLPHVRATQLPSNRQELFLLGTGS